MLLFSPYADVAARAMLLLPYYAMLLTRACCFRCPHERHTLASGMLLIDPDHPPDLMIPSALRHACLP